MTDLDRAIGRLIWVGIRGTGPSDPVFESEIERCRRANAGGIILFDVDVPERNRQRDLGLEEAEARLHAPRNIIDPDQTRSLVAAIRERLGPETVVMVDQEGGFVSRLNPARGFAKSPAPRDFAMLGDSDRSQAAEELARTVADAGFDLNLAPCVDVAVNPDGPGHTALGRSFGRDPELVASLAREQIDAMRARGVGGCLKHFPGHGSAVGDTHFGLVDITETWQESEELAPYRALMDHCGAVMISHLVHRGLDPDLPSSLSHSIVTGLLRDRLGFDGLVLTDSLDMRSISDRFGTGESAVLALNAGVDVALEANNLNEPKPCPAPELFGAIRQAVEDGDLSETRIHQSVARLDAWRRTIRGAHASA